MRSLSGMGVISSVSPRFALRNSAFDSLTSRSSNRIIRMSPSLRHTSRSVLPRLPSVSVTMRIVTRARRGLERRFDRVLGCIALIEGKSGEESDGSGFDESDERQVALCHHAKWNGSGYPRQLVGEAIPLFARIVAVADVFDALSSKRAYKEAWTREQISALFRRESGQHFDPELASIFLEHQVEAERIRARRPE